jgi:hypothetical protein
VNKITTTLSNEETTQMKVVHLPKLWNFVVQNFFWFELVYCFVTRTNNWCKAQWWRAMSPASTNGTICVGGCLMSPAITVPSLLAGGNCARQHCAPSSMLACANCARQQSFFHVPVKYSSKAAFWRMHWGFRIGIGIGEQKSTINPSRVTLVALPGGHRRPTPRALPPATPPPERAARSPRDPWGRRRRGPSPPP